MPQISATVKLAFLFLFIREDARSSQGEESDPGYEQRKSYWSYGKQ
jgi:hypothetical protein